MSEYLENALVILSEMAEAKKMKGKDPCWDGYEMIGTKKKNGKEVPNCVPKNEETELNQIFTEAMKKDEESSNKKVIKKGEQLSGKQEVVKVNPEIPNRN